MLVLSGMLSSCSVLHVKMYCMPTEGKYHIVTVIHECYFKIIFAHTGGGFFLCHTRSLSSSSLLEWGGISHLLVRRTLLYNTVAGSLHHRGCPQNMHAHMITRAPHRHTYCTVYTYITSIHLTLLTRFRDFLCRSSTDLFSYKIQARWWRWGDAAVPLCCSAPV